MIPQLYDCFQHWTENGAIWIISDTHFGDEDLRRGITDRPSDEDLLKLINSKVGKHDTLIHLGDVGNLEFAARLKGRKVLVMGNHDSGASNYKGIFAEIYEGPVIIGPKLILSHEPIMNLPIMFNIHGHIHICTHNIPRHLNACLDFTDYQPIHFNSLIKSGIFKNIDDIHRVTIDKATERVKHQTAIFKKNTVNKNNQIFKDDFTITDDMVYTIPNLGEDKPIKVVFEGPVITGTIEDISNKFYKETEHYKLWGKVYYND